MPFKEKTFTFTACAQVIGHLSKESGYRLIHELEGVSRGVVIISTPTHFYISPAPRGDPTDPKYKNPFGKHESHWRASEFRRMGYKVRGIIPWRSKKALLIPPFLGWYFLLFSKVIIAIKDLAEMSEEGIAMSKEAHGCTNS